MVNDDAAAVSEIIDASEPVNHWFELSYAQFLTVPRVFMQSMPIEWQRRMVECLNELDATFDWRPKEARFWVTLRGDDGRYVPLDPNICNYRRGSVEHLRLEKEASDASTESRAADGGTSARTLD